MAVGTLVGWQAVVSLVEPVEEQQLVPVGSQRSQELVELEVGLVAAAETPLDLVAVGLELEDETAWPCQWLVFHANDK